MDHQNKVQFEFKWHHEGSAGIRSIQCQCGFKRTYHKEGNRTVVTTVNNGDIWCCPDCNTKVEFVWYGMGWIPYIPFDEKHANIEELLYKKKLVQS